MAETRPEPKSLDFKSLSFYNTDCFIPRCWKYDIVAWVFQKASPKAKSGHHLVSNATDSVIPKDCRMKVQMNYSISEQPVLEEEEKKLYSPAPVSHFWKYPSTCRPTSGSHSITFQRNMKAPGQKVRCTYHGYEARHHGVVPVQNWLKPTQSWYHRIGWSRTSVHRLWRQVRSKGYGEFIRRVQQIWQPILPSQIFYSS